MSCAEIGGSPLNPYNKPLTCKTGTAATITAALSAIAVTAGVLALFATQGVHLGPLNALSAVSVPGASVLAGLGGLILIATAVWFIQKAKEYRGASEKVDTGVTEEDKLRLETLFFDEPQEDVTKTLIIGQSSKPIYFDKEKVTFDDFRKKMALMDLTSASFDKIEVLKDGEPLDATSWAKLEDGDTVYIGVE